MFSVSHLCLLGSVLFYSAVLGLSAVESLYYSVVGAESDHLCIQKYAYCGHLVRSKLM